MENVEFPLTALGTNPGQYTVTSESDYERTYDEDEVIQIRKGDVRAVPDVATMSMDFGSGFLDNEQVEALRKAATILGIDPIVVTPSNFVCQYTGQHVWQEINEYHCSCGLTTRSQPCPHQHPNESAESSGHVLTPQIRRWCIRCSEEYIVP